MAHMKEIITDPPHEIIPTAAVIECDEGREPSVLLRDSALRSRRQSGQIVVQGDSLHDAGKPLGLPFDAHRTAVRGRSSSAIGHRRCCTRVRLGLGRPVLLPFVVELRGKGDAEAAPRVHRDRPRAGLAVHRHLEGTEMRMGPKGDTDKEG